MSDHTSLDPTSCAICNAHNARRCDGCLSIRYCSVECQQADWPVHKQLCRQYRAHTNRPAPSYKRAIIFDPDKKSPRLAWIECEDGYESGIKTDWELSVLDRYMGPGHPVITRYQVQRNFRRYRASDHSIEVCFRDNFLSDGSRQNQAIVNVTGGRTPHEWRGSVVAMRKNEVGPHPKLYEDITMADFRDLVDYLLWYGTNDLPDLMREIDLDAWPGQKKVEKVRGVRINCRGDREILKAKAYVAVDVPRDHPIFTKAAKLSPISKLVGFPVRARKYPANQIWKSNRAFYDNVPATFLYLCANPKDQQWWGWAPPQWQSYVGSILVVRDDGKDITPDRVHALCDFCQFKMQPLFEDSLGGGFRHRTREDVMKFMTPDKFEKFFQEFRKECGYLAP